MNDMKTADYASPLERNDPKSDQDDLREQVRAYYAERARSAAAPLSKTCCSVASDYDQPISHAIQEAASCCAGGQASKPDCCDKQEAISIAHGEAAEELIPSWGCGNPTAQLALQPGQTVLDLGSGAGLDAFLAAQRVAPPGGPKGRVIGVDMTEEMLELARKHARELGLNDVTEFRKGHIEALPLDDHSVDVILSNCVINLSTDKDSVFREAYRVLKPGGWLSVSDIVTDGPIPGAIREQIELWAGCIGGAIEEKAYLSKLADAGFEQIEVLNHQDYATIPGLKIYGLSFRAFKPN